MLQNASVSSRLSYVLKTHHCKVFVLIPSSEFGMARSEGQKCSDFRRTGICWTCRKKARSIQVTWISSKSSELESITYTFRKKQDLYRNRQSPICQCLCGISTRRVWGCGELMVKVSTSHHHFFLLGIRLCRCKTERKTNPMEWYAESVQLSFGLPKHGRILQFWFECRDRCVSTF